MKIHLENCDYTPKNIEKIKKAVDREISFNINLNGLTYSIHLDDFTWVESDLVSEAAVIFHTVMNALGKDMEVL